MTMLPWLVTANNTKVAIVGDVILDEYLDGDVQRISPEAPVPVHLITARQYSAGGAANSARNVQLSGGEAHLFSVCGQDDSGAELKRILGKDGISTEGIIQVPGLATVKKTRITSRQQQMLRVDWEQSQAIAAEAEDVLFKCLREESFDAILISDYGKGVLSPRLLERVFSLASATGIPTVVDPKGRDFARYCGMHIVDPQS